MRIYGHTIEGISPYCVVWNVYLVAKSIATDVLISIISINIKSLI